MTLSRCRRYDGLVSTSDRYHHGNLPNALRRAAVSVIDEQGLGGFSMREVARRAGVSHNASTHHFGDMRGLLTSLAREGFDALHDTLQTAATGHDDPVERLIAIGEAYVELAKSHPAHCQVMYRMDVIDPDDPGLQTAGLAAYTVLEDTVQAIIEGEQLGANLDEATWLCWSAMQGLVVLEPKILRLSQSRQGGEGVSTRELVRQFTMMIIDGLRGAPANRIGEL